MTNNEPTNCPHCNVSLLDIPIPEERRRFYNGATHFKREIGIERPGYYDGVEYWQCPDCGGTWRGRGWRGLRGKGE